MDANLLNFVLRLFAGIGVLWLVDYATATFGTPEPQKKILTFVAFVVVLVFILFGGLVLQFPVK